VLATIYTMSHNPSDFLKNLEHFAVTTGLAIEGDKARDNGFHNYLPGTLSNCHDRSDVERHSLRQSIPSAFPLAHGIHESEPSEWPRSVSSKLDKEWLLRPCTPKFPSKYHADTSRSDFRTVTGKGPAFFEAHQLGVYDSVASAREAMREFREALDLCRVHEYYQGETRWEVRDYRGGDDGFLAVSGYWDEHAKQQPVGSYIAVARVRNAVVVVDVSREIAPVKGEENPATRGVRKAADFMVDKLRGQF
ncbi:MAG: hypothetical protein ACRDQA_26420, partial [Nocardioidaceae bacterium]